MNMVSGDETTVIVIDEEKKKKGKIEELVPYILWVNIHISCDGQFREIEKKKRKDLPRSRFFPSFASFNKTFLLIT